MEKVVDVIKRLGYSIFMMNDVMIEYVRVQLGTNSAWAHRAIVKLWERQTMDERASQNTRNVNGVGFNGTDAYILSSFAEQINKGRTLSAKQLAIAFRKLPKYSKQILSEISEENQNRILVKLNQNVVGA